MTDIWNNPFLPLASLDSPVAVPVLVPEPILPEVPRLFSPARPKTALPARRPETVNVWGTEFARLNMEETISLVDEVVQAGRPELMITANLHYLMLTEQYPELKEINQRALAVLADGHPIVARSKSDSNPLPCRVAGADMIVELARLAAERGYRIFFLGAAPGVAQAAADELKRRFPQLQVAGCYSPPFRTLTADEEMSMHDRIRSAKADILLVAFGQPKGEMWISENMDHLGVPLSIQLGASFDFLAGTAKRAPKFWQAIACEWLYRAVSEPKRLVPRYWLNIRFLASRLLHDLADVVTPKLKTQRSTVA